MSALGKGKNTGRGNSGSEGQGEPELTDEQLRELIAQADYTPVLTKEREDAAMARLQPALKKFLRRQGPKPEPLTP